MPPTIDDPDARQIDAALAVVRGVLADDAIAAYVHGSGVSRGLRPRSDLDIFVVSARPTADDERRDLIDGFLAISGSRATAIAGPARSLEVTIAVRSDIVPWRYPPRLDFQYGDWFRPEYARGALAPWESPHPDLAIVLTTVLQASHVLFGPAAGELLDPVPPADLRRAMLDGIPGLLAGLEDDAANVLLTLARIWTTLVTGEIRAKDAAAEWALARLPADHRDALARSREVYLGEAPDAWDDFRSRVARDAEALVTEIERVSDLRLERSRRQRA